MDFHAVVEAAIDGQWRAVDATTLAPRETLVRISTGRDASDTAFLTVQAGRADLASVDVAATSSPDPPRDQMTDLTPSPDPRPASLPAPECTVPRIC
jgi:hypothetical protein